MADTLFLKLWLSAWTSCSREHLDIEIVMNACLRADCK
jgi:hypothetical protein